MARQPFRQVVRASGDRAAGNFDIYVEEENQEMLQRVMNRHHFSQPPSVVLTYLRQVRYWRDWYPRHHHFEGTDRPLEVGDKAIAYLTAEPRGNVIVYAVEWTCVDLWEDKMYRIEGRRVTDGRVADDVTVAINYTLFPALDGGTDFTREIHYEATADQRPGTDEGQQAEAMRNIQYELDKHFGSNG